MEWLFWLVAGVVVGAGIAMTFCVAWLVHTFKEWW